MTRSPHESNPGRRLARVVAYKEVPELGYATLLLPNRANDVDIATNQQHGTIREGEALVVKTAPAREVPVGPLLWQNR